MQAPVSVIVPVHNRRESLVRALESVRAQNGCHPAEILVVDDCSSDGSGDVARACGARVIRHEENRGAAAARNTAIAAAAQPWLALLDSDDEWLPDSLSTLWSHRDGHVLISGACVIAPGGGIEALLEYEGTLRRRAQVLRSPAGLVPHNAIVNSAVMVRRDSVLAAGGYDTTLSYAEDWDLWLRVLETGSALLLPDVICRYHRHPGQKSGHARAPRLAHDQIMDRYRDRPWWSRQTDERWRGLRRWEQAREAWDGRERRRALRLGLGVILNPRRVGSVIAQRWRYERVRLRSRHL